MSVLLTSLERGVLTLELNRPEKRNALNAELMAAIEDALAKAKNDPDVRVILIKGKGKSFCSGADLGNLDELRNNVITLREHLSHYGNLLVSFADVGKPTISCVHGHALAGGCGLAVITDITFAAVSARFGIPEVTRGLWGMMITEPVARQIGLKKSLEYMYTGEFFSATEAERAGLINHAVPDEELEQTAYAFAYRLAEKSPLALRIGREGMYQSRDMEFHKAMKYLHDLVTMLTASDDAHEGMTAFLEKREPIWKGR